MRLKTTLLLVAGLLAIHGRAQNDRLEDRNNIAWSQSFFTICLSDKWQLLAEYQWRRTDGFRNWQQSLLRGAVQYTIHPQISFAAGYGWIETFPYGDFPIAANGRFPEHRLHQQVVMKNKFGGVSLTQRLRIEQRWVGKRAVMPEQGIEGWIFSHRFRYLLRLQQRITGNNKFYLAVADELFIAAGKNVGVNVFDQNRLMLLAGTRINDKFALEAGYLSQTLIQGRRVNNQTIMQDNRGLLISAYIDL